MAFVAGQRLRASDLNQVGSLVGRNQRTTNSTLGTTILRVLSASALVVAGRTYRVTAAGEVFSNSGVATTQNEIRYTTNGVEPAATDTVLARALVQHASTSGVPDSVIIIGNFVAATSGTLFVVVCCTRVAGAVTVAWAADPTFPMTLTIEDVGTTVSTTGTIY